MTNQVPNPVSQIAIAFRTSACDVRMLRRCLAIRVLRGLLFHPYTVLPHGIECSRLQRLKKTRPPVRYKRLPNVTFSVCFSPHSRPICPLFQSRPTEHDGTPSNVFESHLFVRRRIQPQWTPQNPADCIMQYLKLKSRNAGTEHEQTERRRARPPLTTHPPVRWPRTPKSQI